MFFTRGVLQSTKCAFQWCSNLHNGAACMLCCEMNHLSKSSVAAIVYDAEPQSLDRASVARHLLQGCQKRRAQVWDFNGALTWDCLVESQWTFGVNLQPAVKVSVGLFCQEHRITNNGRPGQTTAQKVRLMESLGQVSQKWTMCVVHFHCENFFSSLLFYFPSLIWHSSEQINVVFLFFPSLEHKRCWPCLNKNSKTLNALSKQTLSCIFSSVQLHTVHP